jgi:hypothetical protein
MNSAESQPIEIINLFEEFEKYGLTDLIESSDNKDTKIDNLKGLPIPVYFELKESLKDVLKCVHKMLYYVLNNANNLKIDSFEFVDMFTKFDLSFDDFTDLIDMYEINHNEFKNLFTLIEVFDATEEPEILIYRLNKMITALNEIIE